MGTDSLTLRRLKLALVTFYNIIHNNIDVGESLFDIVNHSVIYKCNTYFVIILCRLVNSRPTVDILTLDLTRLHVEISILGIHCLKMSSSLFRCLHFRNLLVKLIAVCFYLLSSFG